MSQHEAIDSATLLGRCEPRCLVMPQYIKANKKKQMDRNYPQNLSFRSEEGSFNSQMRPHRKYIL